MIGDDLFGAPVENAPPLVAPQLRGPVLICGKQHTYEEAAAIHLELGQTLARMMRKRGSSTPPDGDIGGTPVALAA